MFYDDYETHSLITIHGQLLGTAVIDPDELGRLQNHIRARKEMVRLGEHRAPTWFVEELIKLDSKMRVWWNSWTEEWVLDRLQEEGHYVTVLHFRPTQDFALDLSLIAALKKSDMQRETPAEQVARKREAAGRIQKQNEQAHTDKVLAAVDSLSSKQLKEFIAVEEALHSGDTIQSFGDDRRTIEAAQREKEAALARGEDIAVNNRCINPQNHPLKHKRKRRELVS